MNGVDIGTLAGRIEFEDKTTVTMTAVLDKATRLEASFATLDKGVRNTAQGFVIAEVAIKAVEKVLSLGVDLVRDFTTEGAGIADVEENFNNLAQGAGRVGETMLGVLRQGTHNTIDDFELMKTVNDQFAAGVQLTDTQMRTLADGGFALAQSKGIDVAQAFDTLNQAMLTGNVRAVRSLVGQIDLSKAQDDYALKLGTTAERLTSLEKQEAGRIAILDKVAEATSRLGEQTDGVDEIIAQLHTAWTNFYDGLIKNVAASPQVVRAFMTVKNSIFDALGGSAETIMNNFMSAVNAVADTVTQYAPTVIEWFVKIKDYAVMLWGGAVDAWERFGPYIVESFITLKDWLIEVYEKVISTWDALPNWLKNVAEKSALTAAGLVLVSEGGKEASSAFASVYHSIGDFSKVLTTVPKALEMLNAGLFATAGFLGVLDFTSLAGAGASFALMGEAVFGLIGPLGLAGLYAGALYAAFELGKWEPVSDFFMELGLELQGFSQAEQDAMIAADKASQAAAAQAKEQGKQSNVLENLAAVQAQVQAAVEGVTAAITSQGPVLNENTERTKEFRLAWEELDRLGATYQETLQGVEENLRTSVLQYAALGAKVEDLFQAFPKLTKAQAEAAVAAVDGAREIRKVNLETFDVIRASHGDNINDWIEGEQRKLAITLESLKIQGKLTDDMLNAQMDKFDATVNAEISKRNEANEKSRDYYQKQVDDAQAAYDLMLADSTSHTDAEIRESHRLMFERERDLEHWTAIANDKMTEQTAVVEEETKKQSESVAKLGRVWEETVGRAIEESEQKVQTLGGEILTVAQYKEKQLKGGSFDIKPLTKTELKDLKAQGPSWMSGDQYLQKLLSDLEDREGTYAPKSADQYTSMIKDQALLSKLRQYFASQSSGIPGFKEGGAGDFKEGTLAMLHGPEAIVPLDRIGSLGGVHATFNVNGTAQDSARQIFGYLMNMVKASRQFGTV